MAHGHPLLCDGIPIPASVEGWTVQEPRLEVFVGFYWGDGWVCRSCRRSIRYGAIVGRHVYKSGMYCRNCIVLPDGITPSDLLAVVLTLKLKRRSSRHPDALLTVYFSGTSAQLTEYVKQAKCAGYPVVSQKEYER